MEFDVYYKTDFKAKETVLVDASMLVLALKNCCVQGRLWNMTAITEVDARVLNKDIMSFIEDITKAYIYTGCIWDTKNQSQFESFLEDAFNRFAAYYLHPAVTYDFFYNGWYRDFEEVYESLMPAEILSSTWNIWSCKTSVNSIILTNYGDYRIHAFAEMAKADPEHACHRLPRDVLLK